MNTEFTSDKPDSPGSPDSPDTLASLEAMWDDYRDGTLSPAQQQAFEATLAQDDNARALWQAESQWLEVLGDTEFSSSTRDTDFTASVLARWDRHVLAAEPVAVLGRIEPVSPWRWAASVAAAIILVAGGMFLASQMDQSGNDASTFATKNNTTDSSDSKDTGIPHATSPVSLLVANTSASDLDMAYPSNIRRKVSEAVAVLDPGKLVDLLEPSMPDPADFFEQLGRTPKS